MQFHCVSLIEIQFISSFIKPVKTQNDHSYNRKKNYQKFVFQFLVTLISLIIKLLLFSYCVVRNSQQHSMKKKSLSRTGSIFFKIIIFQWVGSIDMAENETADTNIIVNRDENWIEQETSVLSKVESALNGEKLDAVICVAGGWAGGNAKKGRTDAIRSTHCP